MKLGRMNHIGVVTPSLDSAIEFYRDVMGATSITEPMEMPEQGVRLCFVNTPVLNAPPGSDGGTQVELIEPLGADSPIHGFLKSNPLGGQHHVCFEVPDIHEAKQWFEGKGKRVLGEPRIGAHGTLIFFVHPKDMGGQLTEIMETAK